MIVNKQQIRKELIEKRLSITSEAAEVAAESLSENLLRIIPRGSRTAGYYPVRGEMSLHKFFCKLWERGDIVALPVVADDSKILKFIEYNSYSELIAGKFAIPCPPPSSPEIIPDIIIAPMVGFDVHGNRLGYGGGHYDATISTLRAENKQVRVIGVAYNIQKLANIHTEIHDEKMDMVVTESGIII